MLSADRACREAVRKFLAWLAMEKGETASPDTAAYCKARARLEQEDLDSANAQVVESIQATPGAGRLWHGRRVKVVDGTGLSMPDTPANQAVYPQSKRQKRGCGFPLMKVVALFSLSTGALLGIAKGAMNISERALFRKLWKRFNPGDVVLADRGFCGYATFLLLARRGVDCVMRNHQRRTVGLSQLKRFGKGDRLIQWRKSAVGPKWLDVAAWRAMPARLLLREIHFRVEVPGFRTEAVTVVTTLLDPKAFPTDAFVELYRRRWLAELFLRDIKTTLGMDILRCKSPRMIHKELTMYGIAYNLIRALMLEAASQHPVPLDRISFKGTVATVRQWAPVMAAADAGPQTRRRLLAALLECLARDRLPHRPNRTEPRAVKRRPKNYQRLTRPRHTFKECPHRNHYKNPLS